MKIPDKILMDPEIYELTEHDKEIYAIGYSEGKEIGLRNATLTATGLFVLVVIALFLSSCTIGRNSWGRTDCPAKSKMVGYGK